MKTHKIPEPPSNYPTHPNVSAVEVYASYVAASPGPNYCNNHVPVKTKLNIDNWKQFGDIVNNMDSTLIDQLECGFTMGIDPEYPIDIPVTNHLSARQEYEVIDDFIIKNCESGALLGPFSVNPLPVSLHPSPMQVATSSSGKKRPVLDMSYPKGASINSAIPKNWNDIHGYEGDFRLPTHDSMCSAAIRTKDPVMFICDLKSYYMQIPSDWCDAPFMALTWRDCVILHRRLPFGCRSSCLHAQRVTNAVVAIYRSQSEGHIDGYVDDFGSIVTRLLSASAFAYLHWLLEFLGLDRSIDKDQWPEYIRIFLGLQYNLRDMLLTLPEEKVIRAINMLESWINRDTCSKAQVQSLLGHVNHLAAVVHAARPFNARIVDLLQEHTFPAAVSSDLKQDIGAWLQFLQSDFACVSIIKSQEQVTPDETLRMAINGQTCVIQCDGKTNAFVLESDMPRVPGQAMFGVATWLATKLHVSVFANRVILVTVPTKTAAILINRAKTQHDFLRPMIRDMWLNQAYNDCVIRAVHEQNVNKIELYETFHDFVPVRIPL